MTSTLNGAPQRRVYFATSLTTDEIERRFRKITAKFCQVCDEREADFVVLDLSNPPSNWVAYINKRDGRYGEILKVPPNIPIPCLLFDYEQDARCKKDEKICHHVREIFNIEPRVSGTPEALLDDMKWLQCMLPFTRMTPPKWEELGWHYVLAHEKAKMG